MLRSTLLFLFFCCSLSISLQAQNSWSLEKCIQHALNNSLSVKQAGLAVKQAELTDTGNRFARYPNLNASASYSTQFGKSIDPTENTFTTERIGGSTIGLSSSVILYNGNRITNTIKQGQLDLQAAREDMNQTNNDIALSVANAYINILFAEEQLANAQKRAELTQEQLEQTDKLIRAGSLPQNDRLDILANIARDQQTIVSQQNSVDIAYLELKNILQLEPNFDLKIERPENIKIPATSPVDGLKLRSVYNTALNAQPFIRAGQYRLQSAEIGVDIAKADLLPSLRLFGNIDTRYSTLGREIVGEQTRVFPQTIVFMGQETSFDIVQTVDVYDESPYFNQLNDNLGQLLGVRLDIPIFNNLRGKLGVELAELNIENTKIAIEQNKQQLKSNIQTAIANARAAKEQLAASERTVSALQASYENAQKKFNLGAINTFELTTAKNTLDTAEVDFIVAKYDYLFKLKIVDYYQGKPIRLD